MPRKIILKEGGLNGADAPSGFQFLGFDSETLSLKKGATISVIGGGETGVKRYIAALDQSGTDAPVATVIRNDFDGEVVWSYVDVGAFLATLTGQFGVNTRVIPPTNRNSFSIFSSNHSVYGAGSDDDDTIYLLTATQDNDTGATTPANGQLFGEGYSYIEIIKYED